MATKQDGLRYLKLREQDKLRAFDEEWNDKIKEINKLIATEVDTFFKKYHNNPNQNGQSDGYIKLKFGEFVVEKHISCYEISSTKIDKLRAKIKNEFSYDTQRSERAKIVNQARAIEQQILLHGMSEEIKALLQGF